jgi:hypothetical protein
VRLSVTVVNNGLVVYIKGIRKGTGTRQEQAFSMVGLGLLATS